MHAKVAACFSRAGDGAGLCIDSGWWSSVEEQRRRFEATLNIVTAA